MHGRSHRLSPRVLEMWWATAATAALTVIVVVYTAASLLDLHSSLPVAISIVAVVAAAFVPPFRYRRWRYELRERDLLLSRGALFFVQTLIPFDRIQFVESRQGPVDRFFKLNQVLLYTAAGKAGRVPGLSASQAEALREELARVAGTVSV